MIQLSSLFVFAYIYLVILACNIVVAGKSAAEDVSLLNQTPHQQATSSSSQMFSYDKNADTVNINSNSQHQHQHQQRYIVLIINRLGLANRLRSIADWHQIAILSKRTLLVSWEPTMDCNSSFVDLFESGPPGFQILPLIIPRGKEGIHFVLDMATEQNLTSNIMAISKDDGFVLPPEQVMSDTNVLVTSYDGLISLNGIRCQQYMVLHSQFLAGLQPVAFAREFVANLKSQYFSDRLMVGVHVRSHDAIQDWAVVSPTSNINKNAGKTDHREMGGDEEEASKANAGQFGQGAAHDDFASRMKTMEAMFAYGYSSKPATAVRFFIASNSPEAKQKLLSVFPDAVSISGEYDRSTEEGVFFALLEWLALSESAIIINTHGSSFAVEAAQVHMRPLVGIWNGIAMQHMDVRLPFCGHMQFIRAFGKQGMREVYKEDTFDNRDVSSKIKIRDKVE